MTDNGKICIGSAGNGEPMEMICATEPSIYVSLDGRSAIHWREQGNPYPDNMVADKPPYQDAWDTLTAFLSNYPVIAIAMFVVIAALLAFAGISIGRQRRENKLHQHRATRQTRRTLRTRS